MNILNKIFAIVLALHLVLGTVVPVLAEESSSPPAEEEVQDIEAPHEPDRQPRGSGRNDPESPGTPLGSGRNEVEIPAANETPADETASNTSTAPNDSSVSSDGGVGDAYINTGDGSSTGNLLTNANSNLSTGAGCCGGGGVAVVNDSNGSNSSNTGSANVVNNNTTDQNNSANIDNGLTGATVTGQNSASNNVGDSYINTGNANTTGTIITSANTNVDGVAISEFNIVDDHVGDFILDFGANCISGCDGFTNLAKNSNNGEGSNNDASLDTTTNNTTNQTNNGAVNNDLTLTANSGNNNTNGNTGGDSYITTGTADVAGNVLTFLNNNLAGNVIFGVVNIFGDLVGDIILPESALNAFACATCGGNTTLVNSGNGANSDNNASSTQNTNNTYNQMNNADINNNLVLDATTGGNSASGNTGGDVYIKTGDVNVMAQVLNIANTNLIGGDMWLVIINRAGQWIGQILGAPAGSLFAGSEGSEFSVDENGEITVANTGNGANSDNDASADSTTNNTINQTNNATVNNNLNLSANTGKNSASNNTGGDSYITTGDAEVIANLVNFVNNNIVGGRLLVTFVNVFGNWTGDFLTPGVQKQTTQELPQGSTGSNFENTNPVTTASGTGNNQGSAGNSGSSSNSGGSSNVVAAAGFFGTSGSSNNSNSNNTSPQNFGGVGVTVAGLSNNTKDLMNELTKGASTKKKVKINLGWLVLITPILALAIIGRKLYLRKRV
ncbi:MAG: hypothetical protein US51_C0047G0009 [Microgenomates group bacterium GW2011_GWA2_37_6]|nr:MAG: hypothetical protein US51_C0047G0009 [Microgenomates group bacterium GW2011_GWA2_37_6]